MDIYILKLSFIICKISELITINKELKKKYFKRRFNRITIKIYVKEKKIVQEKAQLNLAGLEISWSITAPEIP